MKYNINNKNLGNIFLEIHKELKRSIRIIEELLKIDYEYSRMRIEIEQLTEMVMLFQNEKIDKKEEKILIKYNGNSYTTLNLALLAILTQKVIILDFDQNMLGLNSLIIDIVNNVLEKFNTDKLLYLYEEKDFKMQDIDKLICIDDIYIYNSLIRKGNKKVMFYSLYYLDFYRDNNDFEEIAELIYRYGEENQIPIESYSEFEAEEASKMMENGYGTSVILLTNKKETKDIFKKNIKNKKIYINKNPFEQKINIIKKEIFR